MFPTNTVEIIKRLEEIGGLKKSIIEADIVSMKDAIEESLISIKFTPDTIKNRVHQDLISLNVNNEEALGLLFISYASLLRNNITYKSLWPIITDELSKYEKLGNTHFLNYYFIGHKVPNEFLKKCIYEACERFELRHAFNHKEDQHYLRNTILLQFGLLNQFSHLNDWISGYINQITLRELLNDEGENYSKTFNYAWRVLKRYRDNLIDNTQANSQLKQNIWFKDLNIHDMLKASKMKSGKKFLTEDKIENIFNIENIYFKKNILNFKILGEDFYALNLSGREYKIYINEEYIGLLLYDDELKSLKVDRDILLEDPESYIAYIEIKNEENEVVYKEDIVLFDFQEGILIFDDLGNYYKNLHSKLNSNRTYSLLIDAELETNIDSEPIEYFDGYIHLIPLFDSKSNLKIYDDGEVLFEANFTEDVSKPTWIDNLVIYSSKGSFIVGESIDISINELRTDDNGEDRLEELDEDVKIMRWKYGSDGFFNRETILNNDFKMELDADTMSNRKQTLHIKIGKRTFIRTLYLQLFERSNQDTYRVFIKEKNDQFANTELIQINDVVTDNDIEKNNIMISTFLVRNHARELPQNLQYIRSKSKFYREFKINNFLNIKEIPKYGESLYASENIFNSNIKPLFNTRHRGYVKKFNNETKELSLHKNNLQNELKMIVLDADYKLKIKSVDINSIILDESPIGVCLVLDNSYIGSCFINENIDFSNEKIDVDILKFLRFAYYPFVAYDNSLDKLRERIKGNPDFILDAFFENKFSIDTLELENNFDEVASILEHILYEVYLDSEASLNLLQEMVLDSSQNELKRKALNIPVFLLQLLFMAKSKAINTRFLYELPEYIEEPEEIDDTFIDKIVNILINHKGVCGIDKLNLKTVMQYKDKNFYIKKALERMIDG